MDGRWTVEEEGYGVVTTTVVLRTLGAVVAVLGLLALGPFFLAAGLAAPLWAVLMLIAIWVALLVVAVVWFRRRPWWLVLLPVAAALIWAGTMSAGEAWLGWTA